MGHGVIWTVFYRTRKGKGLGLEKRFVGCSFGCLINKINVHNNFIHALFVFQETFQLLIRRFEILVCFR